MKFGKYKISIALSLAFGFLFFVINAGVVHAQYTASESLGDLGTSPLNQVENSDVLAKSAAESAAAEAVAGCKEITIPKCDTADCSAAITALNNIKTCMNEATKNNAKIINTSEWKKYVKEYADKQAEIARHAAIASAFKSSLSLMSKQLAVDTATWIASGGKGQKPLFITEGWGAYLKNLGDSALGDFIDQVGQRYGVDLCKSPTLSLSIQTSLNWKKPRQVRCTFSKMMTNWESAITDPNFAFEYNNSLNSGENDLSVYLKLSGESLVYVADKVKVGELDVAPEGWKAVKDFAGKVLTPGDVVKEWLTTKVFQSSSLAEETFTGTVADFVNTFVQTLVGQLLNNFKSGLFSSGSNSNGNSLTGLALPDLSSLLNSQSQPYSEGVAGAEARFNQLKQSEYSVGGPYDILSKLMTCSDSVKDNPGPTDCVIDQTLGSYIKDKKQVWQISDDLKKRKFAPNDSDSTNYSNAFTYRTILILRKYRIVPIGWEIAANYLKNSNEIVTLGQLMDQFDDHGSKFYGLVDPYWVLKAPEVYCRRQGYGDHNTFQNSQDGSISRDEYCADEQQCIKENANGSCAAYGYCTEERRFWNFGTNCDAINNTCQTFKSSQGEAESYLSNSLDYRNCNSSNAGCKWYSNLYDPISRIWRSLDPESIAGTCDVLSGCLVNGTGLSINQYHQVSDFTVGGGKIANMPTPCSASSCTGRNQCTYNASTKQCSFSGSCTVPYGASSCNLENCLDDANLLSSLNGNFEQSGDNIYLPKFWREELSAMSRYTREFRAVDKGQNNSAALEVTANNAPQTADSKDSNSQIITLDNIVLSDTTSTYQLKFSARADYFSEGEIDVQIYHGSVLASKLNLTSIETQWNSYLMSFEASGYATATIKIITKAGTTAQAYFDNFELKRIKSDCQENSVSISMSAMATTTATIYFNRNVQTCDGSNDGCTQFIRTKPGLGSNLTYNGGFEFGLAGGWTPQDASGTVETFYHSGTHSLSLACTSATCSEKMSQDSHKIILEKGKKYFLSGWIYIPSGAGSGDDGIGLYQGNNSQIKVKPNLNITNSWQQVNGSFTVGQDAFTASTDYNFDLLLSGGGSAGNKIYFDDIKLEEVPYNVSSPSAYSEYNPSYRPSNQLAFLKMAPDYYNCYKTTTTDTVAGTWANSTTIYDILKNRNVLCSKYAPVCTADEVGCELYTPLTANPAVPGVAETLDVCPGECVGYQVYKQEETDFVSSKYSQFIADNSPKYCSADMAGCDEFTNLDDLARGAEHREYYVHFQVCEKPGVNGGTYYTWEGNDTVGYQLKVYNLKKSNKNDGTKPCTDLAYATSTGQALCQDNDDEIKDTGYCKKDDMVTNPDCREFYDANGNISHRLLSETITISANCHPYRRTMTQSNNIEAAKDCNLHKGFWNGNNECIYMAIPDGGQTCSASVKGCRAYTGNTGNNVRNILNNNFDVSTDTAGWLTASNATATMSNVSTFVGGHSLIVTSTLKHAVDISSNRTYILSFWAKGDPEFFMDSIKFNSATSVNDFFFANKVKDSRLKSTATKISGEWKKYDLGPVFVHWDIDSSADNYLEFNLPVGAKLYLNNIVLKEVQNSVYLVENSWYTPFSCDNNLGDDDGSNMYVNNPVTCADEREGTDSHRCVPGNMLGCSAYRDRSGNLAYLKSFAKLCRAEAAGCEKLINTHNYDNPNGQVFNPGSGSSVVTVPPYETVYLVADSKYACPSSEKGCTAYGLPSVNKYDEAVFYGTSYLKNFPDRYKTDLCQENELWCDEYAGQNSFSYFKNPHGKVCEYVKGTGSAGAWYKQGTTETCTSTANQTLGTGYDNQTSKIQPVGIVDNVTGVERADYNGWAGICSANQSGCSEYVDPLDNIYTKLRIKKTNTVNIKTNTLYNSDAAFTADASCGSVVKVPGSDSFYYVSSTENKDCSATVNSSTSQVSLAGVYYKLSGSVNAGSCTGVNFRTGCVLFNNRGQIDYSSISTSSRFTKNLIFDAQATYANDLASSVGVSTVSSASNTANIIVSANADRTCGSWLSCNTYQKAKNDSQFNFTDNDKCLGISMCQSFGENGNCNNLETSNASTSIYNSSVDKNKTGYVMINPIASTTGIINNPYDAMGQLGGTSEVVNGDFEMVFGSSSDPIGWVPGNLACKLDNGKACGLVKPKVDSITWNSNLFKVVYDPKKAESGSSYLQLNGGNTAISENVGVDAGQEYYLSFWVNTTNLLGSGNPLSGERPYAEVQFLFLNEDGKAMDSSSGSWVAISEGGWDDLPAWKSSSALKITQGTTWKHIVYKINPPAGTTDMKVALFNLAPDATKGFDGTKLGGYSMWDNIGVNTVLDTNGNDSGKLSRSCRIYPASDAPGCRYNQDSTQYYGQYGYCLLKDPATDNQQCLQWWPVDNIAGESVNDYSAFYKERMPLYYCVNKRSQDFKFTNIAYGINADNLGDYSSALNLVESHTGVSVKYYSFSGVPASMRTLLRYPYIYRFNFLGTFVGAGTQGGSVIPLVAFMKPYEVYGVAGFIPFYYGAKGSDGGVYATTSAECNSNNGECDNTGDTEEDGTISQWFADAAQSLRNFIISAFNKIRDTFTDAFSLSADDYWGGWGIFGFNIGKLTMAIPLPNHTVHSLKIGGGLLIKLIENAKHSPVVFYTSLKIVIDTDANYGSAAGDPHSEVSGDILGYAIGQGAQADTDATYGTGIIGGVSSNGFQVDYCDQIVQVVNSSGQQKAYSARTSLGSSYKTEASRDWDCVTNTLYGDDWEKAPDKFKNEAVSASTPPTSIDRCFDHSAYCMRRGSLGYGEPLNYCSNYVGETPIASLGLKCCGTPYFVDELKNTFQSVCNSDDTINRDYFCNASKYIYKNIYHVSGYNYTTDRWPFASLVNPVTSQYPTEWDSKDDVPYKQPMLYEANMSASGIGQARMGQKHDVGELKRLFAKSYGAWQWVADSGTNGEIKGQYVQKSGLDWSVPTVECEVSGIKGIGKREEWEKANPAGTCFNYPEVTRASITNINNEDKIMANSPIKLEFNVNVDPEQLPIRSYSVNWGDNSKTTFSGTALLGRPATSDPFILYHYYGDDPGNGNINISVTDNWNKKGTKPFSFDVVTSTP